VKLADVLGLLVPALFLGGLVLEALFPAQRDQPRVRGWRVVGLVGFSLLAFISTVPAILLAPYAEQVALVHLAPLGIVPSALIAYLVYTLISYGYHRACHTFPVMWRLFHQIHHSAPRLDLSGAAFFHPLDMLAYALLTSVVTLLLGLSAEAAGLLGVIASFYGFFQHLNVHTPRWLGVIIQRPESHSLHHEVGVHARNYADFPMWDMVFGTYENPVTFQSNGYGFAGTAWKRWGAMLRFVDVNEPTETSSLQDRSAATG
jgi:sterol desaturase/sphingolipid hydroxylase (fatty acid hydroxylase superfamily)